MDKRVFQLAKKGRDDLFWLCKNVLGYTRMRAKPHQELINWLDKSEKRTKLVLMPRGSFKVVLLRLATLFKRLFKIPT